MSKKENKICTKGIWNSSVPGIKFYEDGSCNYARLHERMMEEYPRGDRGQEDWKNLVETIKSAGKGKRYDCVIGVSGGTDSCYLLHIAKEYGLRPLAVNLDNGWSSDIAVKNIKKVTSHLGIDLETYVIDYEEVQAVLRSYVKAGLPWIDSPTDIAIKAALYKIAGREGIKVILNGSDFRSEGKQPTLWTYSDTKQLKFLVRKYENIRLKTFPYYSLFKLFYYGFIRGIKMHRPLYYLDYNKQQAQELLIKKYEWEYYGEHHHENLFTKFTIACWLPQKFQIDKRIITYSAQVVSGQVSRNEALKLVAKEPYDKEQMERDKELVIKKLNMLPEEFNTCWSSKNHYYYDYPSYMPFLKRIRKLLHFSYKYIFPFKPTILFEQEEIAE